MILSLSNEYKHFRNMRNVILIDNTFLIDKSKNVKIFKLSQKNKTYIKKIYDYCDRKYEIILKSLSLELNQLHGSNNSKRYWEIIIGNWLKDFIYVSHKNFFTCKSAIKKNKFKYYIALKDEAYKLYTRNTVEMAYAANDSEWNFSLNSKILEFLKPKIKPIYKKSGKKYFKLDYDITPKIKQKFLEPLNLLNKLFNKNKVLIYQTSLPFLTEKKLEMKIGQSPTIWKSISPIYSDASNLMRKKISLLNSKKDYFDDFEVFLRKTIPLALPIFIVETFKQNLDLSFNLGFPKEPEKIFTCTAASADELFKIYLAEQTKRKAKYFCGQHGNNYFTSFHTRLSVDVKTPDKFLSWGYANKKENIIPISNFKCIGKLNHKRYFNKEGKLLMILNIPGHNRSTIERHDLEEKQIKNTLNFFKTLNSNIRNKTMIRISKQYKQKLGGYYFNKYFKKLNNIQELELSDVRGQQLKSRLNFFNYYSTGLLENLVLNIPSICYLIKDQEIYNNFFINKIKLLIEAKIIFFDEKKLRLHLNDIWEDVDAWWQSKKTQKLISKFNSNFNIGENNLDKLVKILKVK